MKIYKKIKREVVVFFSKFCLKSASNNYFGLSLRYPVIYGMGRGYVVPEEAWMGQCLQAFINSKDGCVIDVGVNVGVYLVKLKALSDDRDYYGFEPNAICNYYTNELIRMNNFKSSHVLPVALSDKINVQTLYASKTGDKTASLVYDTKSNANLEYSSEIVTVKGDDFIKILQIPDIAVIKIDVEGAEQYVMNGLVDTIEKYRPFFYIEIWASGNIGENAATTERVENIYTLVTNRNYTVLVVSEEKILKKIESPVEMFNQEDPNYIFVPNELLAKFNRNLSAVENCEVRIS